MQKNLCKNNFAKFFLSLLIFLFFIGGISAQQYSPTQNNTLQTNDSLLKQRNGLDSTAWENIGLGRATLNIEDYTLDSQAHYYYLKKSLLDTASGFETLVMPLAKIPVEVLYQHPNLFVAQDEIYYTIVALFLMLGLLRSVFPDYFTLLYSTVLSSFNIRKTYRETNISNSIPSFGLSLLFYLGGSMLIMFSFRSKFFEHYSYLIFLGGACALLVSIYLLQIIFTYCFSIAFGGRKLAWDYVFMINLYNNIFAILALILSALMAFSGKIAVQRLSIVAGIILVSLYLTRWLSSYQLLNKRHKINLFHFFLYLCGVEILPLLLILKTFYAKVLMA